MKKSKIIIFSMALALLLFANISVTLFEGSNNEIGIKINQYETYANPGNDDQLHNPLDPEDGGGDGNRVICYSESYLNTSYTYTYCGTCKSKTGKGVGKTLKCRNKN
jgi:hypothetical protein